MPHVIIVHGDAMSGKTTWIQKSKIRCIEGHIPIEFLIGSLCCIKDAVVCVELINIPSGLTQKLEGLGFSVSFRLFRNIVS